MRTPHPVTPFARGFAGIALGNAATCLVVQRTSWTDAFAIALLVASVSLLCVSSFVEARATACGPCRESEYPMNHVKTLARLRAARIVLSSLGILICIVAIAFTVVRPEIVTLQPVAIAVFFAVGLMRHLVDLHGATKEES